MPKSKPEAITFEQRKAIAVEYAKFLAVMKKNGWGVQDIPEELQQGFLELQQNALMVTKIEREQRKTK